MIPLFSPVDESFRAEVRRFLAEHPHDNGFHFQGSKWDAVKALYRAIAERNWLALSWPKSAGGLELGAAAEFILWDEMAYARAARPPLGAGIVAKTIYTHGTDAQKSAWLDRIRSGEIFFSLGYSEPGAGSDLASLRTRAELKGDRYFVSGEKCWTSYAQHSDYLWALVRTGPQESRSKGLSFLIIDLHAPGVTVRPLPTIDGEQLNQVHLDSVEVSTDRRIGPENGAWRLVKEALDLERHLQFPPARVRRDLEDLVAWAKQAGLDRDPRLSDRLAELAVGVLEVEALALKVVETVVHGRAGDVEAACNKLAHTELCQKIARTALEFGGQDACVRGQWFEFLYRQSMWETIGGGTSEIMRGVIARQDLGLGGRA